jgi:hypothetical protein
LQEFGYKALGTVQLSLNEAVFNDDVFSLDVAEVSQSLPKSLNVRSLG